MSRNQLRLFLIVNFEYINVAKPKCGAPVKYIGRRLSCVIFLQVKCSILKEIAGNGGVMGRWLILNENPFV